MKPIIWKLFWMFSSFQCLSSTYRLDKNIVPNIYTLDIYVDKNLDYFLGKVIISLKVDKPQTHVSLHFYQIKIKSVYLNNFIKCTESGYNRKTEIGEFQCNKTLRTGDILDINYNGSIATDTQTGIFKTTYNDEKIITTFFQSAFARRLFPCFDEPFFKANFSILVTYPKNYKVFTNTHRKNIVAIGNNFEMTSFQTTPKMSTYLVTVVIAQLESAFDEDQIGDGYNFNIYTRPGFKHYVGLCMEYGKEIIDAIGLWTKVDYGKMGNEQFYVLPLPNFKPMAMENWGLLIFRERGLFDEGYRSSTSYNESVMYHLTHEIAHQWFGNYVSCDWWSDTWLNEGLATYIGNHLFSKAFDYSGEDFEKEKQFVGIYQNNIAFALDSLPQSTPVGASEDEVNTMSEFEEKLNKIVYFKGASIVRMITYLIGMKAFRQAMTNYLNDRKFSTATTSILLNHIANASLQNKQVFATKMHAWIYKAGYPIVTAEWNKTTSEIVLTQKSYHIDETQWYIPISYTNSSYKNFTFGNCTWLEPNKVVKIPYKNKDWIIFNLDVVGFYRVKYDTHLLNKITDALKGEDKYCIGSLNKAQLIYDMFSLAEIGEISYVHVFNLLDYLRHETDYYPWYAAFSVLRDFFLKIDYESQLLLKKRILSYIDEATSVKTHNTFYVNKHINILKKNMMQEWACKMGQKACIEYAKTTFNDYKISGYLSDYELRDMIFCYALKHSTVVVEDYQYLLQVYRRTNSPLEKSAIFRSLGCISNSKFLWKLLNNVIHKKLEMDWEIIQLIFKSMIENDQTGLRFTLDFFKKHIRRLKKLFTMEIINILNELHEKLFTQGQKAQFLAIMRKLGPSFLRVKLLNMTNKMDENIKWANKYGHGIKSALDINYSQLEL